MEQWIGSVHSKMAWQTHFFFYLAFIAFWKRALHLFIWINTTVYDNILNYKITLKMTINTTLQFNILTKNKRFMKWYISHELCTFCIAHFTIYALALCYFYIILVFYSSALSTERTWFDYISLLVIPCIIYYVTNKETLTLTFQPLNHQKYQNHKLLLYI